MLSFNLFGLVSFLSRLGFLLLFQQLTAPFIACTMQLCLYSRQFLVIFNPRQFTFQSSSSSLHFAAVCSRPQLSAFPVRSSSFFQRHQASISVTVFPAAVFFIVLPSTSPSLAVTARVQNHCSVQSFLNSMLSSLVLHARSRSSPSAASSSTSSVSLPVVSSNLPTRRSSITRRRSVSRCCVHAFGATPQFQFSRLPHSNRHSDASRFCSASASFPLCTVFSSFCSTSVSLSSFHHSSSCSRRRLHPSRRYSVSSLSVGSASSSASSSRSASTRPAVPVSSSASSIVVNSFLLPSLSSAGHGSTSATQSTSSVVGSV